MQKDYRLPVASEIPGPVALSSSSNVAYLLSLECSDLSQIL